MTEIKVKKHKKEVDRFRVSRNGIWGRSVEDNNFRLDRMEPTPENLLHEIKLIEAVLLTRYPIDG